MLVLGGAGGTVLAHGAWIAPNQPVLERVTIRLVDLPPAFDGFTIAQLSDLHVQPAFPPARLRPALLLANRVRPDLIVLTGDYVSRHEGNADAFLRACARACGTLRAPHGVVAVFGNHDFPTPPADPDPAPWRRAGITTLCDEVLTLRRGGNAAIYLIGLRSFLMRPVTPADVLAQAPEKSVRIVLWHEPDRAPEAAAAGASLQLSGHTHGGQIALPFVGPPLLPPGGKRYPSGRFEVNKMPLYVSRGVGMLAPRVRINCPPEVTLLTLRRLQTGGR